MAILILFKCQAAAAAVATYGWLASDTICLPLAMNNDALVMLLALAAINGPDSAQTPVDHTVGHAT